MIAAMGLAAALVVTPAAASGALWDGQTIQQEGTSTSNIDAGVGAYERGDFAEAFRWFRMAADQGVAEAQVSLGLMYGTGQGVTQNDAEAVRWFRLAADQCD